jgi:chromosome segregation ATPase
LRADYESLLSTHEEMKGKLSLAEQQLTEREDNAALHDELETVKAQLNQLQAELREVSLSRDKAVSECGGLRSKQGEQRNTIDALNKQLERSVYI